MKKILLSLCLFALYSHVVMAQKQGIITYNLSMVNTGSASSAAMQNAMPNQIKTTFKDTKFRTDMPINGNNASTIYDADTKKGIVLMDMMGKKMAMDMDYITAMVPKDNTTTYTITETKETKLIAGYLCQKAVVTNSKNTDKAQVYYTTLLPIMTNEAMYNNIKGAMLSYSQNVNGLITEFTATKVDITPVDDKVFEIPTDYEKIKQ